MNRLSYRTLASQHYTGFLLPDAPETVLQFGEGGFMRSFADYFIDLMNEHCEFNSKVVLVQPRGGHPELSETFAGQDGLYTLLLRGQENGKRVSDARVISAVSRCLDPKADWNCVLQAACQPQIRFILSNTTEAGIAYDGTSRREDSPPAAFPAKLLAILLARYELGLRGCWILPCELNDRNGELLRKCLYSYMNDWDVSPAFRKWFEEENFICSTLVDRIATGYPSEEAAALEAEFGYADALIDTAEVFASWVIEAPASFEEEFPFRKAGLPILVTDDHTPYKQRKVRILNGAHTAMVMGAYLAGKNIVRECMSEPIVCRYLEAAIYKEIIPTLDLPAEELQSFAESVRERFSNPFIDHSLLAISLNSAAKWRARVLPSVLEYHKRFGTLPRCLVTSFALWLAFCSNAKERTGGSLVGFRNGDRYEVRDDAAVLNLFYAHRNDGAAELAHAVIHSTALWGVALSSLPGFEEMTTEILQEIRDFGVYPALERALK